MRTRSAVLCLGLVCAGSLVGFGLRKIVHADGIPDVSPLYYSGTLIEGGQPVTGTRAITLNLWADGTTAGTPLCQTVASTASVTGGRFRIALAGLCKAALNQNNSAWIEVVDGATSVGRAKIGAVPYAVEADHAVAATSAGTASSLAAGPIVGSLAIYNVPGGALAAPCALVGAPGVVDCTCPVGTFVVSGGGDAGQATGRFIRESRPITTSSWRVTCAAATADVLCAMYSLVCSRVGP
jgi:hypothetical protein